MITVYFKDCNRFSQNIYKKVIDNLPIFQLKCSCGKSGCLILFGKYERQVKYMSRSISIEIQRVRCRECGRTHALLPSLLVPYSWIPLKDQQDILRSVEEGRSFLAVLERNPLIDESDVKYIVRQFRRHWKQRLLSAGLTLCDELIKPCFSRFSRQFMQIHRTPNILFH